MKKRKERNRAILVKKFDVKMKAKNESTYRGVEIAMDRGVWTTGQPFPKKNIFNLELCCLRGKVLDAKERDRYLRKRGGTKK